MPGKCSCAGSSCGCSIQPGTATSVRGTGTGADPFLIDVDPTQLNIGAIIAVTSTNTVRVNKTGSGGFGDPVILSADILLRSPSGQAYTLTVSDSGALTAVPVAA